MTEIRTHERIDRTLCGEPVSVGDATASVRFETTDAMRVDERGLVHGGFVFGLVDHAAMLAVNDPNVVLGSADVRFIAPVRVGDAVVATAVVQEAKGKKRVLDVYAAVGERKVLTGTMTAFVLDKHILDP